MIGFFPAVIKGLVTTTTSLLFLLATSSLSNQSSFNVVNVVMVTAQPMIPPSQSLFPVCNICPTGGAVTNPMAFLTGINPSVTCGDAQVAGQAGLLDTATCTDLKTRTLLCGCTGLVLPTPAPTVAPPPVPTPPTTAPTPVPSPQPFCNICRTGFVGCNGVIGNSVCQEVNIMGLNNALDPVTCTLFQILADNVSNPCCCSNRLTTSPTLAPVRPLPTAAPTRFPTRQPTEQPTVQPTPQPTERPTPDPTPQPTTIVPTSSPTTKCTFTYSRWIDGMR